MKKKFDRFIIRELLAEGGSGAVYQAEEQLPGELTRPVALKLLSQAAQADPRAQQRFLAEAKLMLSLGGHPNVVTVYGVGQTEDVPWIAMEWAPATLVSVLREMPLGADQVASMMRQVAAALAALHGLNPPALHNDLTPNNILVDRYGGYKVTDFALAGPANVERTRVLATVRYAAPELLSREFGALSPATDLYALGHIAYEMALGGKLYRQQFPAIYDAHAASGEGATAKWMAWHCSHETTVQPLGALLSDFPPALSDAIAKLMRKPAAERIQDVGTLLSQMGQAAAAPVAPARPGGASAAPAPATVAASAPSPITTGLPTAAPEKRYYVRLGAKTAGPFDVTALQRLVHRGEVSRLHKVSLDRVTWQSIVTIEGLF